MTAFTSFAFPATNGTRSRTDPDRWGKDFINANEFGTTFDDVQLQAAIDAAWANNIKRVIVPKRPNNNWTLTAPVFQDPPANLRSGKTPTQLLAGQTATPSGAVDGIWVQFDPTTLVTINFNTAPAWWVGTGVRHRLSGLNLYRTLGVSDPQQLPTNCTGIAIASGNGGAVDTFLEDCSAQNFYSAYRMGQNGENATAENNKLYRCRAITCYKGIWIENGQALVNHFVDCQMDAKRNFVSNGQPYIVVGGEHGSALSQSVTATMSSVSTLSGFTDTSLPGGGSFTNYTFTATIASPDEFWTACPDGSFVYNVGNVVLTGFGAVPIILTAFNAGTGVATFQLLTSWTWFHFGEEVTLSSGTDFNTELQACTTVYMVQRCTFAEGPGHIIHPHIETPAALVALCDQIDTTSTGGQVVFDRLEYNTSPAFNTGAFRFASQTHPFIKMGERPVIIKDSYLNQNSSTGPILIDGFDTHLDSPSKQRLIIENSTLFGPNLRYAGKQTQPGTTQYGYDDTLAVHSSGASKAAGFGEWDMCYWPFRAVNSTTAFSNSIARVGGSQKLPFFGYMPAREPRITTADLATIASPGAIGTNPMMCGGRMHVVNQLGALTYSHARDKGGNGYSYYADLTLNWSYKGQTQVVTITTGTQTIDWLFNGLEIGLDNGGGVVWYLITGVYGALGYITVYRESTSASVLAGTKTTTYTGATVKQRAATIEKYGAPV